MSKLTTMLNSENEVMVIVEPGRKSALIAFEPRDSKSFKMTIITDDATRTLVVMVDNSRATSPTAPDGGDAK